ncbi:sulfatase-like hydrolase/transferase [Pelagicoccus mobilis]|uniref:Sulfatase-like hydrolase/transferase n=1 Tax=Pelagicoccus mobilis TaxID=415221 RepID=A0A934RWV9_9BACT|nr:sulfatase-like hydrolase/transferase [Pelagicoccus mobilis]MBK1876975.1 sulfatase-like hydrolase/transferase [Pelagicoccus mobilis]
MKWILAALFFGALFSAYAEKPNVIVFMADDMGYADAGFTGATDILTPNLDRLAQSGVVFKQGYANHAFCGPSRAAFLSGRYQHRFGFETNPAYDPANPLAGIDVGEKLFPARMQDAGYVTGCIGKWHLGAAEDFHPNNRGFDYFYGFLGGGHDYFKIDLSKPVKEGYLQGLVRNKRPADFEGYLTTALSRDAVRFVQDNKDNPFFLFVSYNAPHQPLQAPKEDLDRYSHIDDKKRRAYAAMIDVMDRGIGEVMQALEENGLRENTLVFFTSDNGGPQPSKTSPKGGNASKNGPFRGGKGNFYDGGVHVPFIASWPAKIKGGITYDYPVIAIDIARTAVAVAGGEALSVPAMEGVDLVPYLSGEEKGAPHEALFWRGGDGKNWSVLASNGDKYLLDPKSKQPQMYHLPDDVSERNDILAAHPERAMELFKLWEEWNEANVACRLLGYKDYHGKRSEFYESAVPERAKQSGYSPEARRNF